MRKANSQIKRLALPWGHQTHRYRVMAALWPKLVPEAAANNLSYSFHAARRNLCSGASKVASRYLQRRDAQFAPCPDVPLWVGVDAFRGATTIARRSREPAA